MSEGQFLITVPDYMTFEKELVKNIPKRQSGVYCIEDNYGEVVYIGKSKNLGNRITSHFTGKSNTSEHYETFESVRCFYTDNLMFMDILEIYLISTMKPKHNRLSNYSYDIEDRGKPTNEENNEIWKFNVGQMMAYTEDLEVIYSLNRYYFDTDKGFKKVAEYRKSGHSSPHGIQFSFPPEKRRVVERLLKVKTA